MPRSAFEPVAGDRVSPNGTQQPFNGGTPSNERLPFPSEVVNPFVNDNRAHGTVLQKVKMVFVALTFLPIRIVGFLFFILVAWISAHLALVGYTDEELRLRPIKEGFFKKLVRASSRCCMFFLGYQWFENDVQNWALRPDGSRKRANVVIVNHSTVCDGFLLYYVHGLMSVGISAVADAPIFSTYAKAAQAFSLNRDDAEGRKKIGAEMHRRACWTDEQARTEGQWNPLVVFAEGTCTNQKALIQFRHGAFLPGVPVQPMIVRYPFRYCDQSWCGLSSPLPSLIRVMCQFHNRLQFSYLPVYEPSEEEKNDPYLYAENVRRVMAEALAVPTTEHTFEDMKVAAAAIKLGLPWREIHCEMGYFRSHGSNCDRAKAILSRFADADTNKDGYLSVDEFRNMMNLRDPLIGEAMFERWTNGTSRDRMSFRHYYFMTGLRIIHGAPPSMPLPEGSPQVASPVPTGKLGAGSYLYDGATEEQQRFAHGLLFSHFDQDRDGLISPQEFIAGFRRSVPHLPQSHEAEGAILYLFEQVPPPEGSTGWSRNSFERFLASHVCIAEHFLATL